MRFPRLYAEEYDVTERQLRGNLPQAFVHALMLECAVWLADSLAAAMTRHDNFVKEEQGS